MTTPPGSVDPSGAFAPPRRVVGVGASAGGLESLEHLFSHVPRETGLAFVVVQHLSPDFRSVMDELLARFTPLPVRLAEDGEEVRPDHVYLLPPGKEITIRSGCLRLADRDPSHGLTLPIDLFLTSLAQDQGSRSAAVILSGTGSDGSRGLQKVKRAGGLVVVENPESAKFDGMPASAIATGEVDHVVEAREVASALLGHPPARATQASVDQSPLDEVFRLLRDQFGLDFSLYKTSTVSRRVLRRVELQASADLGEYVEKLRSDPQELSSLYRDLLIGVTRFFRDPEAFQHLEEIAVPEILSRVPEGEEVRAWVAGCATGEEAYSLAMILHERLTAEGRPVQVKILATDVHRASLDHASAGIYGEDQLEHVSEARRKRYFLRRHGRYQVAQEIRQLVVFAPHNMTKDAPFSKMHLVTCRNVLIYFEPLAQRTVLSLFHFGLAPGGILFLGASESPGPLATEFVTLDEHWKIYRKRRETRLLDAQRLSVLRRMPPAAALGPSAPPPLSTSPFGSTSRPSHDLHLLATYDQLLDRYMPPAILVDEDRILIDTFGGADRFLRVGRRRPSMHLLDLVDGELRIALAGAIQRALESEGAVAYQGVPIEADGSVHRWTLVAERYSNRKSGVTHVLLSFRDEAEAERGRSAWPAARPSEGALPSEHVRTLEAELAYTRETLQATIEELQTSNEELQATNEELVASNEELQSTNEELHSVNEELYTVNAEYQKKIHELRVLNSDIQHLLEGTEVGTLFLDRQLKIRKFTPRVGKVFRLHEPDVGRDIRDLTHILERPALFREIESVLDGGPPVQADVRDKDGVSWFLRVLPYRPAASSDASDPHRTEGVVLTLTDISPLERARARVEQLSAIVEQSGEAILGTTLDGRITAWNTGAERLFERSADDAVGRDLARLLPPVREAECRRWLAAVRLGDHVIGGDPTVFGEGPEAREVAFTLSPIRNRDGAVSGASIVARDITPLRQVQSELAEREARVRQILDSTAEAILGVGLDGACTFCNPAAVRLLGLGSAQDLIGRRAGDLARRAADGTVIRDEEPPLERVLRTGRGVHADGELLVRADGSTFPAEYWIHPVRRDGRVDGAVLTFLDVTDRKRAEAEIVAAARRREQFLAMLSHELRNPLAAVLASTRLLQATGDAETLGRAREVIERQSTHMARLLDDLLDVSRITRGGIELRRMEVDLRAVVTSAIEAIGAQFTHRRADLSVELPDDAVPVNGDPTRLQQVVVNLLSNAARYSPSGSPIRLTLTVERDRAIVEVVDAGYGIEADALESIFELSGPGPPGPEGPGGGRGGGLTLVRTIVEQHGGRVEARSEGPGKGSTFSAWLPVDSNAILTSRGERSQGRRRVVVVEDQPDSRQMLALLLRRRGHEVVEAADGPTAVEVIARERPDVALVDIGLPLMSGYEVARCLRETRAAVDVLLVALTGYGTAEDVKAAYDAGFDAHLTKPADPEQVEDLVHRARVH